MNAKRIWIASYPAEPDNVEVKLTDPNQEGTYIYSKHGRSDGVYCLWREYIILDITDW